MENRVTVDGLVFKPYITYEDIHKRVESIAADLRSDLENKNPMFICVLTGAFIFAADLIREVGLIDAPITFVRYSSYEGTDSTGMIKELMGLNEDVEGRDIVIIEDIVDTGMTATRMVSDLRKRNPKSIRFCTLLHKPMSSKTGFKPYYVAFEIPPKFIIGYGLDIDGKGRNLKDIYVINED